MLLNLHVKNLALIEEADIDFEEGLNILTGETGAGKSLLLGSINIALGNKVSKDIIRADADEAMVQLVFDCDDNIKKRLDMLDIDSSEDIVVITRKITRTKSISKINGETVTVNTLKSVMSELIDIHGQHDHQSLLYVDRHLEILDKFIGENAGKLPEEIKVLHSKFLETKNKLDEFNLDEDAKIREMDFLKFEINEIQATNILPGEDEELEKEFKKLSNARKLSEILGNVYDMTTYSDSSASSLIDKSVGLISQAAEIDEDLGDLRDELMDIDALCKDFARDIYQATENVSIDEPRLIEVEERLDLINHLKQKYGNTYEEINDYLTKQQDKLDTYLNYDNELHNLKEQYNKIECELKNKCNELTKIREKYAKVLSEQIVSALKDLNFLDVKFEIEFTKNEKITAKGNDSISFMISTNPGETLKPLAKVASGGELSRIMLAIKTILAKVDHIETLIFDEIDTGISGRTAQMVANKLIQVSNCHQTICITHLAQIAAMADTHFLIEKNVVNGKTVTNIRKLDREESICELVRITGGAKITEEGKAHADQMKEMADNKKQELKIFTT